MEINGKDVYFVAIKALVRKGDELLITHDIFDAWDIPGGRIKKDEFNKPLEQVLERKLTEELGAEVTYTIGTPKTFFRVERVEAGIDLPARIFAVGYEVEYIDGPIILGRHHDKYEWVNIHTFKPDKLFNSGWAEGLEDYLKSLA